MSAREPDYTQAKPQSFERWCARYDREFRRAARIAVATSNQLPARPYQGVDLSLRSSR